MSAVGSGLRFMDGCVNSIDAFGVVVDEFLSISCHHSCGHLQDPGRSQVRDGAHFRQ